MALNPLDIRSFFEEMELNLIANLIRNIFHHKDEEKKEGFNWRAWQAEALKNIDIFRRQNAKYVNSKRPVIDESTKEYLDEQYSEGSGNRERLKFFRFNSDRYDALANEVLNINTNIYSSALRSMDDEFRNVISKRRLNMRSGGMSLRQAIDSATQDFLDRGITSIQYRDGRRVNIASYREMALRTAGSRAQFIADGQLREMMGRDLVLISQYGACSKTCLPWQGRVYIDDVFQEYHGEKLDGGKNGISRNGKKYTLLSFAMAGGLFHPNCRHTMVDYIEGITEIPPRLDAKTVRRNSELEQEQRAKEREIRRLKRYVTGTLDPDKRMECGLQLDAAQKDLEKFINENSDVLRQDPWRERLKVPMTLKERMTDQVMALPQEQREALKQYTGAGAQQVNTAIKLNKLSGRKIVGRNQKLMETLDKALENGIIPETTLLHRDTAYNFLDVSSVIKKEEVFENPSVLIGKVIHNPIFVSTSFENLNLPGRDTEIWLTVKAGTRGCQYLKPVAYDSAAHQEEILFKRDLMFRILNANISNNKIVLSVEAYYGGQEK